MNPKQIQLKNFFSVDSYIKLHKLKEVTNSVTLDRQTQEPTLDGLYSKTIFTDQDNDMGFINVGTPLLEPYVYGALGALLSTQFKYILNREKTYVFRDGEFFEDPSGKTGISFLYSIWDKIDWAKYKKDKNISLVDSLTTMKKDMFWHHNVLVMSMYLRPLSMENGRILIDDITAIYEKILRAKTDKSEFYAKIRKDSGGKSELIQKYYIELWDTFMGTYEKKYGEYQTAYTSKRANNNITMVANSNPDVPVNSCVIPWHYCLVLFDSVVYGEIIDDEEVSKKVGIADRMNPRDFGQHLQYIQNNPATYEKTYPGRKEAWISLMKMIFDKFPDMGVMLKRNPVFELKGYIYYKVIINTSNESAVIVPAVVYNNLGADSFYTENMLVQSNDQILLRDDDDYKIEVVSYSKITPTTKIIEMIHMEDLYNGII